MQRIKGAMVGDVCLSMNANDKIVLQCVVFLKVNCLFGLPFLFTILYIGKK